MPFVSTTHYSLLAALKHGTSIRSRVDPQSRPPEIAAAWARGDIDAAYVWDPALGQIKTTGGKVVLDSPTVAAGARRPSTPGSCARTLPREPGSRHRLRQGDGRGLMPVPRQSRRLVVPSAEAAKGSPSSPAPSGGRAGAAQGLRLPDARGRGRSEVSSAAARSRRSPTPQPSSRSRARSRRAARLLAIRDLANTSPRRWPK